MKTNFVLVRTLFLSTFVIKVNIQQLGSRGTHSAKALHMSAWPYWLEWWDQGW